MAFIPWRNKRDGAVGETTPMIALRNEMNRLFDTFVREPFGAIDPWAADKWSPAVDIAEDDKEVTVRAELPGIDPKDLEVSVVGNQIILSGEKKESSETKEKGVYHSEMRYGAFRRTVPLPDGIDAEHIDAHYAQGVLTLRLPKTPQAATKRIEVKVK